MIYFCCDQQRREAVAKHPTLMGIDFLDVESGQQQLRIHFVRLDASTAASAAYGPESGARGPGMASRSATLAHSRQMTIHAVSPASPARPTPAETSLGGRGSEALMRARV